MSAIRSLGKVTVAVAGTIVRATSTQAVPASSIKAHSVFFQALPTNTGRMYIGGSTLNKTTFVGVFGIIAAPSGGATGSLPSFDATIVPSPNGFDLTQFWIDADIGGDGVLISHTET